MATHAGETNYTEQPSGRRFRPETGWTRVRVWKGAKSKLETFLNNELPTGVLYVDVDESVDGYCMVKGDYSFDPASGSTTAPADPVSRVWTLQGNDIEVTPWALPKMQSELAKITNVELRARIVARIEALIRGETQFRDETGKLTPLTLTNILSDTFAYAIDPQVFIDVVDAMASGIEAFPVSQYVLRKVETVVAASQLKVSHENTGRMLTYGRLIADEPTLPSAILIEPGGLQADHFFLKRTPTVDQMNHGQWQLTQEYWAFKSFNKIVYGAAL